MISGSCGFGNLFARLAQMLLTSSWVGCIFRASQTSTETIRHLATVSTAVMGKYVSDEVSSAMSSVQTVFILGKRSPDTNALVVHAPCLQPTVRCAILHEHEMAIDEGKHA